MSLLLANAPLSIKFSLLKALIACVNGPDVCDNKAFLTSSNASANRTWCQ